MPRLSATFLVLTVLVLSTALLGCPPPPNTSERPVAGFTASPRDGNEPLVVQFTDTSTPGASPIVSWNWDFGDGETSTRPNPRKTYFHDPQDGNEPSLYTVRLTVTSARGSDTRTIEEYISVSAETAFDTIDPEAVPYDGTVTVSGVVITVPPGALDREVVFGVKCLTENIPLTFFEPMDVVSCSYTITHNNVREKMYASDGAAIQPATLDIPLLPDQLRPGRALQKFQILAVLPDGRTIPLATTIIGNKARAQVTGLPAKATYTVVYRPESMISEVDIELPAKTNTGFTWQNQWHINASVQMVQQLTALRLGTIAQPAPFLRSNYSAAELQATVDELGAALAKLHLEYSLYGFRSPVLANANAGYSLIFYDINPAYTSQYGSFQKLAIADRTFGSIVIDPRQLLSVSLHNADLLAADAEITDSAQKLSVPNVFAQELFLACFEGYEFPRISMPSPSDLDANGRPKRVDFLEGLRQGAAVYLGQWADGYVSGTPAAPVWARGFEPNEYYLLSNALFQPFDPAQPGYAVAGQEFFLYAEKSFSDLIVTSLVPLLASNMVPARGILEELRATFAAQPNGGRDLDLEEALQLSYAAVDRAVAGFTLGSLRLPLLYWAFVRDRAVENGENGLLREADALLASFTLKPERLADDAVLSKSLLAATDKTDFSADNAMSLEDIPPLTTRAIEVLVNPLASELTLTFNSDEWELDDMGGTLAVAAYKPGINEAITLLDQGQDTDSDGRPDTLTFQGFFPDPEGCYAKVIVLVSNLSLDTPNTFAMTAESFAGMPVAEKDVLQRFVYTCDPSYSYDLVTSGTLPTVNVSTYVLQMTSGAWRGSAEVNQTLWQHYITIIEPPVVLSDTAMLMVSGGSTGSTPDMATVGTLLLPFAASTGSVVALIQAVPNEPLQFTGETRTRTEDAIIAYSYDKYMTGFAKDKPDMTWPALLPMTRAAVRAMDSIQEFMDTGRPGRSVKINDFVVAGASKRGWTTWLTAAADNRVRAIIPIVIDVLNMDVQMEHHFNSYGFYSNAIQDYVQSKVFERFGKPEGDSLLKIVDPYEYLDRLTMPKFIANSTGDQFFLPDSSKFYFNDLVPNTTLPNGVKYPADTYLYYAPNTDHGLTSSTGLGVDTGTLNSILAFYNSVIRESDRPQFTWWVEEDPSVPAANRPLRIRLDTVTKPTSVLLWQATNNDGRDFRLETIGADWVSTSLEPFCGDCGGDPGFAASAAKVDAAAIEAGLVTGGPVGRGWKAQVGGSGSRTSVGAGADAIPVVVVSGSPYEMGFRYGELMQAEIQAFVPSMLALAQASDPEVFGNSNLDLVWNAVFPHLDARFTQELQGVADGAGIAYEMIRRTHMIPVVSDYSCSSIAVWDTATVDGHLYQTRNLDWDLQLGAHNYPCIVVYNPTEGIPHANVGFAGLVGSHTGINAEGIVLAEMGDSPSSEYPFNYDGNHFMPMFREILYDANNLTEALSILGNTARIKRYHYVFGDGRNEHRAVKIRAHAPETPPNDLVIWTDNDPADEFAPNVMTDVVYNDEGRGAFPHLQADHGAYDSQKLIALANMIPIVGNNVMDVVYDATALTMWVAYAEGSQEAYQRPYVMVDLNQFFQTAGEGEGEGVTEGEGEGAAEGEGEGQAVGEGEGEDCECEFEDGEVQSYAASVPVPEGSNAWTAFFIQVTYPGPVPNEPLLKDVNYVFSSRVVVVPDVYPVFPEAKK
jgi:PhoPQ-activated pathogenicity-related protein